MRDDLVERRRAVEAAEREREPGAGGRERLEPEARERRRRARIPWVRDDERLAGVKATNAFAFSSCVCVIATSCSREMAREYLDYGGITSVVVSRAGEIVREEYVAGAADTLRDTRSCTKTVLGMLLGIAIEQRLVTGVDIPVLDLLGGRTPRGTGKERPTFATC